MIRKVGTPLMSKGPLRYAIVGAGAGVLGMHRGGLTLPEVAVVAGAESDPVRAKQAEATFGCPISADYRAMLAEIQPDVTVIAVPHPLHAEVALAAFAAGSHVLCEKPMAIQVADADRMIAAAAEAGRVLGVCFQRRLRPEVQAARHVIASGALGAIQRVDLFAAWPRTARYYRVAPWRGTWRNEGGGVLMNQGPHNLDTLAYLLGLPARVVAWNRTRLHAIAAEDTAHALLEWSDGALGTLHLSTAEGGVMERLTVAGTRGALTLEPGSLRAETLARDIRDHIADDAADMYADPPYAPLPVTVSGPPGDHATVYRALNATLLDGAPFPFDGVSGRSSLELANALILSSFTGQPVALPLDRAAYAECLAQLQAGEG